MSQIRADCRTAIIVLVFLVLALNAVLVRANMSHPIGAYETASEFHALPLCDALIPCVRAGVPLISAATIRFQEWLAALSFTDLSTSRFEQSSRWKHHELSGENVRRYVAAPAAWLTVRILPLTAVLAVALLLFRTFGQKVTFLVVTLFALAGWNPTLVGLYFHAVNLIFDWPNPYFLFGIFVGIHELWAIGFIMLLFLFLATRQSPRGYEIAAVAAFGQLFMENLGIATTIAVFLRTLLHPDPVALPYPWRTAGRRLAAGAAGTVLVAGLLAYVVLKDTSGPAKLYQGGQVPAVLDVFVWHWNEYGRVNFAKWPFIVANLITLCFYPALLGAILGWLSGKNADTDIEQIRQAWFAAVATTAAFVATLFVGMFISGMMSDLGRQAMPLVCLTVPLAIKGCELWRRTLSAPRPN